MRIIRVLKIIGLSGVLSVMMNVCDVSCHAVGTDLYSAPPAEAKAHLALDTTVIDMGCIPKDSVRESAVGFRNTGKAPLVLVSVFSECGCTTSFFTKDSVAPGESGEIRVKFNSKGRRQGEFRKPLRIRSNADNPRKILFVKGRVE